MTALIAFIMIAEGIAIIALIMAWRNEYHLTKHYHCVYKRALDDVGIWRRHLQALKDEIKELTEDYP